MLCLGLCVLLCVFMQAAVRLVRSQYVPHSLYDYIYVSLCVAANDIINRARN